MSYINNPQNLNNPICSISVFNRDGIKFKEVVLKARNFKIDNNNTYYDGNI